MDIDPYPMKFWRKFTGLFSRRRLEREMADEMQAHLDGLTERNIAKGMSPEEARYAAQREFGGVEQIKEQARDVRHWVWLDQLVQDLRYAVRQLFKSPAFTCVALVSLALGIGTNTAIFSSLDAILLKPLSATNPDQLVRFSWLSGPKNGRPPGGWSNDNALPDVSSGRLTGPEFSLATYERIAAEHPLLSEVFAFAGGISVNVNIGGQPELQISQVVSGTYYTGLGVAAYRGRTILPADDVPGAEAVVVLSYAYWQQRFAGDPAAVGRTILVNRIPVTIIGIMPPDFADPLNAQMGPLPLTFPIANLDRINPNVWGIDKPGFYRRPDCWWLRVMGRLRPGITPAQAAASLETAFQESAKDILSNNDGPPLLRASAGDRGLVETRRENARPFLILIGLTALVLVAACTNLGTLSLARAAIRRREIAVRLALGASRRRIICQLLTESMLLAVVGAAGGLLLAIWGGGLLASEAGPFHLDGRVLVFTITVTLLTGVGFGLAPALRATRVDITTEFQGGSKLVGAGRSRLSRGLVVVQVAVAAVLLTGAGLFVRTLHNLNTMDVGFDRSGLLLFQLNAGELGYENADSLRLFEQIQRDLARLPGVTGVTFSDTPLLSGKTGNRIGTLVPGAPHPRGRNALVSINPVADNFFDVTGMHLLLGRTLLPADGKGAARVAVVNEAFVQAYFGDQNPVGRYYTHGTNPDHIDSIEIVGVVRDARFGGIRETPWPSAYVPYDQRQFVPTSCFTIRCDIIPAGLIDAVRKTVSEADQNLPLTWVRTQDDELENHLLKREHTFARLSVFLGGIAVLIACIGLYGLVSYTVHARTNEIGLRMALGAWPRRVEFMVLRESMGMIGLGLFIGLTASLLTSRFVESLLYDVSTADPLTYVVVTVLLPVSAAAACWLPARRAAKVDPMEALRHE